ncbi:MAG TPA: CRISPR-associated protein Cas5, partial [Urbifossiella sp.]|nr:CRISPR-associated protein Cas5 [Urbifossiella sp.]
MSRRETVVGVRLDALDPLLFRDGRPFDAAARVSGGLPTPQTAAGALRTAMLAALGFDFGKFARARKTNPAELRAALLDADKGHA